MSETTISGRSGQVQSLVRALRALEVLSENRGGMTLTALARALTLPRSTAHRLLTTMNGMRFVIFENQTNRWRVGPQAFAVGAAFGDVRDLARLGRPYLIALNLASRETVSLSVPDKDTQIYIGQVRGHAPTPGQVHTGDRLPIHYTASGKSIMAYWPDAELNAHFTTADFSKRTEASNNDTALLAEKLGLVRERGYAFDCEESVGELRCVGAPVFDALGEPIAALSISAPTGRMEKPRMHTLGCELKAAAMKLTATLSGLSPLEMAQA